MSRPNRVHHIVALRQTLQRWRRKAREAASTVFSPPSDVPVGHVAIYVGRDCKRFLVKATYLNHPIFESLLLEAEEKYGFDHNGPLTIPCDELFFEDVIRVVSRLDPTRVGKSRRCGHVARGNGMESFGGDVVPLLHG